MARKKKRSSKRTLFRRNHPHLYFLLAGLGIVMFWRGVWGILDAYLLPQFELVSFLISIAIGVFILFFNDFSLEELTK